MIEVDQLLEEMDKIILAHGGASYNGKRMWGSLILPFRNGWRKDKWEMNLTIESKEKNSRLNGESDALGKRM